MLLQLTLNTTAMWARRSAYITMARRWSICGVGWSTKRAGARGLKTASRWFFRARKARRRSAPICWLSEANLISMLPWAGTGRSSLPLASRTYRYGGYYRIKSGSRSSTTHLRWRNILIGRRLSKRSQRKVPFGNLDPHTATMPERTAGS